MYNKCNLQMYFKKYKSMCTCKEKELDNCFSSAKINGDNIQN